MAEQLIDPVTNNSRPSGRTKLVEQYLATRSHFLALCSSLAIEDYGLQADVFVSPPKWHLAHTTWFFETFILKPFVPVYQEFNPNFEYLFNSYYNAVGEQFHRHQRGLLSRPTLQEVLDYRDYVDAAMQELLSDEPVPDIEEVERRCLLGIQHEKQHQELFFMDIKYSFFQNPLYPALFSTLSNDCFSALPESAKQVNALDWKEFNSGLFEIGAEKHLEFCFDNELPRHKVFVHAFSLADRLVANGEYLDFIEDAGYQTAEHWLADGWTLINQQGWKAPLYWVKQAGEWFEFTLYGLLPLDLNRPVTHVSGYEAQAFAHWAGARLPTEAEWEVAGQKYWNEEQTKATSLLPESILAEASGIQQLANAGWQWTSSAYHAYPGYQAAAGALGEYNGKFMSNQWVLRGGSSFSPTQHLRPTYRNFFCPQDRWPMTSIRLAR